MTEAEWNACTDPEAMLDYLGRRGSDRKLRLFAVACCRRVWRLMTNPGHRGAVEAADQFADGRPTDEEFEEAFRPVVGAWARLSDGGRNVDPIARYMTSAARHVDTGGGARYAASFAARGLAHTAGPEGSPEWDAAVRAEEVAQCGLIRDLFGNPSLPFHFEAAWLSGEGAPAVRLADEIHREGQFGSLSALADVLECARYTDRSVLDHCRRPESHTRGCWVIDALLGRESAVHTGLLTEADWQTCENPEPLLHFLRDRGSNRQRRLFTVACCRRIGRLITDERSRRAVEVAERYASGCVSSEELEAARASAQEALREAERAEYSAEAQANFCLTPAYAAACHRLHAAAAARSAVCRDPRRTDADPDSFDARRWQPGDASATAAVEDEAFANFGSTQGDARWEAARHAAASARAAERKAQCRLLRDLFGQHLGPPGAQGAWLPSGLGMGAHTLSQAEQWCLLPTPRDFPTLGAWLAWNHGCVRKMAAAIYDDRAFDRLPLLADALQDAGCADAAVLTHCREPGVHVRGCWVIDLLLGKS